jgi:hypothetical protein
VQIVRGDAGEGVGFAFNDGTVYSLPPGGRTVVVKNRAAFLLRYGNGVPVAGEYAGRLDSDGDLLILRGADGGTVSAILFDDNCPWPGAADGSGYSLTFAGGNPAEAANWRTSLATGGTPGGSDRTAFPGGADLAGYALGPHSPSWRRAGSSLIIEQRRVPGSDDVTVTLEMSGDLANWPPAPAACAEEIRHADGAVIMRWTVPDAARMFIRLRLALRSGL